MSARKNFLIPLTNSKGLGRVIFFSGLDSPVVAYPALLDEPLITAQPFYFLSQVDCVAKVSLSEERHEGFSSGEELEEYIDRLLDNYLFSFSRAHPELAVTAKMPAPIMHPDMLDDVHFGFDHCVTACLAIDQYNDDNVKSFSVGELKMGDFNDHVLIHGLIEEPWNKFVSALRDALGATVVIEADNHPTFGNGTVRLPIARLAEPLLTREQLELAGIVRVDERRVRDDKTIALSRWSAGDRMTFEKEEMCTTAEYEPELLAYYFCGLRDLSPVARFKNFYNVLEYFFDENDGAKEVDQLIGVLRRTNIRGSLEGRLTGHLALGRQAGALTTAGGVTIPAFPKNPTDVVAEYGRRVYAIRNACLHSKRIRKGQRPPRIVPSMREEELLRRELSIVQDVAGSVIETLARTN